MTGLLASADKNERINILNEIGHHYLHNEEWNNAKLYFQSALDLLEEGYDEVNQEELGKVHIGLSYIFWKQNELDQSLEEARLAIEIFILAKSGNLKNAKRHLAIVLIAKSEYREALSIFAEVRFNYDSDENENEIAKDNYHIATAHKSLHDYPAAISSLKIARELFSRKNLIWMLMMCDKEFAHCYYKMGRIQEALSFGLKSFETANFLVSYENVVETSLVLADIYLSVGNINQGIFQLNSAREIYLKAEIDLNLTNLANIDNKIAELLEAEGKIVEAEAIRKQLVIFQNLPIDNSE